MRPEFNTNCEQSLLKLGKLKNVFPVTAERNVRMTVETAMFSESTGLASGGTVATDFPD